MYFRLFSIPKAVYFYCVFPILLIIIACLIFKIIYRRKKGTYYYIFNNNYFLLLAGILVSAIMIALLAGYSIATIYTIFLNNLFAQYYVLMMVLVILPLIPLCLFIWLSFRIYENFQYKKELDKNLEKKIENEEKVEV